MKTSKLFLGFIFIAIGLSSLFNFPFFHFVVAFFIIYLGIKTLLGNIDERSSLDSPEIKEDILKRVLIFSGINTKIVSSNFKKAQIVIVFGGGEIDLSAVETKQSEIIIEVVEIFGGVKLTIPDDWIVRTDVVGIVGGLDNHTHNKKETVIVTVKGVAVFGGVEIVNK